MKLIEPKIRIDVRTCDRGTDILDTGWRRMVDSENAVDVRSEQKMEEGGFKWG